MFTDSNILLFLLAVLPGLFYAWLIYVNSPRHILKPRLIFSYLLYGMMSVFLIHILHFIFPHWTESLWTTPSIVAEDCRVWIKNIPTNLSIIFKNYIQVGLSEEFCKGLVFLTITSLRIKSFRVKDSAYSIMYYMMMVSLGFALIENIEYGTRAYWIFSNGGEVSPTVVLIVRSVTAIIAHMLFGLIMGFFFALGFKEIRGYNSDTTIINVWARNHNKLKKVMYFLLGLFVATFLHGSYNYSLGFSDGWLVTISLLVIGLISTFFMSRKLIRKQ